MIPVRELRIGNLVAIYTLPNCQGQLLPQMVGADNFVHFVNGGHGYEPIPLTPEILEKAGFVNKNLKINSVFSFYLMNSDNMSAGLYVDEEFTGNTFQYLHQLQNLHFALTGEELEINL